MSGRAHVLALVDVAGKQLCMSMLVGMICKREPPFTNDDVGTCLDVVNVIKAECTLQSCLCCSCVSLVAAHDSKPLVVALVVSFANLMFSVIFYVQHFDFHFAVIVLPFLPFNFPTTHFFFLFCLK